MEDTQYFDTVIISLMDDDGGFRGVSDGLLAETISSMSSRGTLWLEMPLSSIIENLGRFGKLGLEAHLGNCLAVQNINSGNIRYDSWLPLTKAGTSGHIFHSCEYLREVIAAFTDDDGNRRGWDYYNGMPARFTGIGNSFTTSDPRFTHAVMLLTTSDVGSRVHVDPAMSGVALALERRPDTASCGADGEFAGLLRKHVSTSEPDSAFSGSRRSFMPSDS